MKICSIKNIAEFNLVNKHNVKYISNILTLVMMPNFSNINTTILQDRYQLRNIAGPQPLLERLSNDSLFLGFKISKKIGNAVKRNKLRRQIKAIYHKLMQNIDNLSFGGNAIIIVARSNINNSNFIDLQNDIMKSISYFKRKIK